MKTRFERRQEIAERLRKACYSGAVSIAGLRDALGLSMITPVYATSESVMKLAEIIDPESDELCPVCGHVIYEDWEDCPKCGTKVTRHAH